MKLTRHDSADGFLAHAGEFLGAREAEHNLILGLSSRLQAAPLMYGEPAYFAVVEEGSRVVGVTMRTPPHNLILSELDDLAAIGPLLEDARSEFASLPGVVGPKEPVARFAQAWSDSARLEIAQRAFRADHVDAPSGVPGQHARLRARATASSPPAGWTPSSRRRCPRRRPSRARSSSTAARRIPTAVSCSGRTTARRVSMAGFGGRTPNGIRVGPVYTPPELRGRGYASALTAALTQRLLDGGLRFCFLFTDLANPTSNSIYQRIGYEPVSDVDLWSFSG